MSKALVVFVLTTFTLGCVQENQPLNPIKIPIVVTMEVNNINSEGVTLNANIEELGINQNVKSFGFVISERSKPLLNTAFSSVYAFTSNIRLGMFSSEVKNNLVLGKTYFVRAFVQTDDKIVYGSVVSFLSKGSAGPEILSFTPKEGSEGTEVVLRGKNFSRSISGNRVLLDVFTASVVFASDTLLRVKCPKTYQPGDYYFSVEASGKQSFSKEQFKVLK